MPILDRRVEFDERSRQYPIRTLLQTTPQPRSYTWPCQTFLDQGEEGACVGFAWCHEAAAVPVVRTVNTLLAYHVYREAKTLDPWPGEGYEGTSVLAGAKAMQRRGYLQEYRWAFGLDDALTAISRHGPAVLGLNWYEGMFDTDETGRISPTGRLSGGHAILATGVNVAAQTVTLHNSWGLSWGRAGKAKISWDDLDRLLHEDGEVCVPVVRT